MMITLKKPISAKKLIVDIDQKKLESIQRRKLKKRLKMIKLTKKNGLLSLQGL